MTPTVYRGSGGIRPTGCGRSAEDAATASGRPGRAAREPTSARRSRAVPLERRRSCGRRAGRRRARQNSNRGRSPESRPAEPEHLPEVPKRDTKTRLPSGRRPCRPPERHSRAGREGAPRPGRSPRAGGARRRSGCSSWLNRGRHRCLLQNRSSTSSNSWQEPADGQLCPDLFPTRRSPLPGFVPRATLAARVPPWGLLAPTPGDRESAEDDVVELRGGTQERAGPSETGPIRGREDCRSRENETVKV